uniref:Peptidase C1A papain C-terminal domain-containing protein n=1 Tax=Laticauda laticaudata TaxID=8630 RepID=A0A8C5RVY3_LATLA
MPFSPATESEVNVFSSSFFLSSLASLPPLPPHFPLYFHILYHVLFYNSVKNVKQKTADWDKIGFAVCGSCWSFATTGALEGALFLKTGVLTPLSQQILIDCSWGFGNRACDGGQEPQAFEWIMKHGGIATAEAYGPYMEASWEGYQSITSQNLTDLKAALYKHGPIAVNIDASHKSFAFYSNGIYYEPNCGNTTMELDHAVLAVGYGDLQGEPYWLIKNSWSTYWGNDGYILMSMKENNCGVTSSATYPILA